ncbi:MAG TPA: tetratricopeptide repeat protein [Geminicoccus sp.]|uniref:tetratricopeptide repeat protein n=1 Tax=Geminicoccus sp. TaxID=2024832 RepID=UPI002C898E64|nr:tetratricopeptide repeat protein [Geminicoccus sp.]HWL71531.1 tetratricopeptide repeat protein [Geminicoccus sp.]
MVVAGCLVVAGTAGAQLPDDLRQGYEAYRSGEFAQAAAAFGRAIEAGGLDPEALAVTLNNRGVAYSQLGDYDAAIADYLEAQKLKADDPTTIRNLRYAYLTRGLASAQSGDRSAALTDYDRALAIDPNYLEALQYRGALRIELGMAEEAARDFRQVLALEPGNAAAAAALATLAERAEAGPPAGAPGEPGAVAGVAPDGPAAGPNPDTMAAAVERSRSAEERAQASLDEALRAAREAEPTAGPEQDAAGQRDDAQEGAAQEEVLPEGRDVAAAPVPGRSERPAVEQDAPAEPQAASPGTGEAAVEAAEAVDRYRISAAVNMRGGPDNSFPVVGVLTEGTLVRTDREQLGWYRIPAEDGRPTGWVYRRFLIPAE